MVPEQFILAYLKESTRSFVANSNGIDFDFSLLQRDGRLKSSVAVVKKGSVVVVDNS